MQPESRAVQGVQEIRVRGAGDVGSGAEDKVKDAEESRCMCTRL